jgi:hypothetical protein
LRQLSGGTGAWQEGNVATEQIFVAPPRRELHSASNRLLLFANKVINRDTSGEGIG